MYSFVKNRGKIANTFLVTWSTFRATPLLLMGNDHVVKVKHNVSTTANFLCQSLRHLGLPCAIQKHAGVLKLVQRSVFINAVPRIMRLNEKQGDYNVSTVNGFCDLGKHFCIAALYNLLLLYEVIQS